MFCPECGQQHSSPNVRFCTQCGFQLGVVSALLAQTQSSATGQLITPRRPLLKRGAMLGVTSMWLAGVFAAAVVGGSRSEDIAAVTSVFWVILMIAINLFGPVARLAKRLFTEQDQTPANHYVAPRVSAPLPPPDARVGRVGPPRANVGEQFHPPGIIEHTTRSLGREQPE